MTNSEPHQVRIPRPADEEQRLAALYSYQLLDTAAEDDFDLLTEMAAQVCQTPFAFVSLVDRDRVWIKSRFGINAKSFETRFYACSEVPPVASEPGPPMSSR